MSELAPREMMMLVQALDFGVKIAVSSIANAQNAVFLIIFVLSINCLILFPVSDKDNFFLNMKLKFIFIFLFAFLSLSCLDAFAQDQEMDEEKRMDESIEQVLENLERNLKLEGWQVFYLDSIMRHDYTCLRDELKQLQTAKAANADLYNLAQDKWMEQIYVAFQGVMNEDQWAKYLKMGAAREKKARDKRAAKRQKESAK